MNVKRLFVSKKNLGKTSALNGAGTFGCFKMCFSFSNKIIGKCNFKV